MNIFVFFLILVLLVYFFASIFYSYFKLKKYSKLETSLNYKKGSTSLLAYLFLFLSILSLLIAVAFTDFANIKNDKNTTNSIVFLLDVSKSMKAMDINNKAGTISRLDESKNMIKDFVSNHNNFSYWLSVFAWETIWIAPLGNDLDTFLTFLSWVDENNVWKQWTDIYSALSYAIARFLNLENNDSKKNLVLFSDWWDEIDSKNYKDLASIMKKNNINLYIVWVWTNGGWYIPEKTDFMWEATYKMYNWQKVLVKLNQDNLKSIASSLDAKYYNIKDISSLDKVFSSDSSQKPINSTKNMYFIFMSFFYFLVYIFLLFLPKILWKK